MFTGSLIPKSTCFEDTGALQKDSNPYSSHRIIDGTFLRTLWLSYIQATGGHRHEFCERKSIIQEPMDLFDVVSRRDLFRTL
ncbi:MAG: hypothetical protein K0R28_216 [Paenibacillus sp.]|jgi:hypothetical protein|nr:hypothetical protein [Paenibacillus sp.]